MFSGIVKEPNDKLAGNYGYWFASSGEFNWPDSRLELSALYKSAHDIIFTADAMKNDIILHSCTLPLSTNTGLFLS